MGGVVKKVVLGAALVAAQVAYAQGEQRSGKPSDRAPLNVTMLIEGSQQSPAMLIGRTNMPDGSRLTLSVKRIGPPCQSHCGFTIPSLIVSGGTFLVADQPTMKQIGPGKYEVEVIAQGAGQPESVSAIVGKLGENLRGPLIVTADAPGRYVPATFPRPVAPSMGEKTLGLMVRHVQMVDLDEKPARSPDATRVRGFAKGAPDSFDPASCRGARASLPPSHQDQCRSLDIRTGMYTPDWRPLGSGRAAAKIDMNSILRGTGGAEAIVYAGAGDPYDPRAERKLIFDCRGHYQVAGGGLTTFDAVPGTVGGEAAAVACSSKVNTARP